MRLFLEITHDIKLWGLYKLVLHKRRSISLRTLCGVFQRLFVPQVIMFSLEFELMMNQMS